MRPKIALVEDDYLLVLVMSKFLTNEGYECLSFSNAKDFFQSIDEGIKYKTIILDIKLKGQMDGVELFKIFSKTHRTPVIFATGNSDVTELRTFDKNQVKGILIKPVHLEELTSLIQQL
jgi:DNA-binding NtrC family response regulator